MNAYMNLFLILHLLQLPALEVRRTQQEKAKCPNGYYCIFILFEEYVLRVSPKFTSLCNISWKESLDP